MLTTHVRAVSGPSSVCGVSLTSENAENMYAFSAFSEVPEHDLIAYATYAVLRGGYKYRLAYHVVFSHRSALARWFPHSLRLSQQEARNLAITSELGCA